MVLRCTTAEDHRSMLVSLQNRLGKVLEPYEEFVVGAKTYYLSPGGFLHRKEEEEDEEDPGSEEGRGYFCGYLDDEAWQHLKNHLEKGAA